MPRCRDTQLVVTGVQANGAAVTDGWVVRYKNASATACTLEGYPNVVEMIFATGKSQAAKREHFGYIGGWQRSRIGAPKSLPTVVLRARTGVASSMVEWVSTGTAQGSSCPVFTSLWVNVPGGTRAYVMKSWMLVCTYLEANPFVPGDVGWAN
jgi:hypothetical protein